MNLDRIICEAKACSAVFGAKHALLSIYGDDTKQSYWDMLRLNSYIRTLERNKKEIRFKKEIVKIEGKKVPFCSLIKTKDYLSLKATTLVVCKKEETSPCLNDQELAQIVESVRLMCSDLTCNCN